MMLKSEIDLLRAVPLFAAIDPSRLKLIAYTAETVAYRQGQVLCRQGDAGDAAYVLIEGEADVSIAADTGDFVVAALKPGDVVGEIAILCDVPRTATVRATTQLSALRVRKEAFLQLVKQFPEVATEIMRGLAERLTHTNEELVRARNLAVGEGQPQ
ncbi:cyclic nucleotide-binding domain-containing protein [Jiella sp. MQZ9-1]|uniref:Cyclic nucleotide-binding domain-containing protein n=1 Tax=Jiella flava TaxID=2816857 RepID=A0A939G0S7_9HYPH|nr:cyclic nucleotide-binding domain-containing protein [Jiella flava]MBO0663701.1 cyclic nucleotide-binding domain-containing protein [Jiella flava]MCD2472274.1 cyclic nucleotide-binding domain-containing protein [Jiella flava]